MFIFCNAKIGQSMKLFTIIFMSLALASCGGGGGGGNGGGSDGSSGSSSDTDTPAPSTSAAFSVAAQNISETDTHAAVSWWGENKSKLVISDTKIFTSITDDSDSTGPYVIKMMERSKSGGTWVEGINIDQVLVPVDILLDSEGYVHILAYEVWVEDAQSDGRYVHYKMDNPNTVSGTFTRQDAGSFEPYNTETSNSLNYANKYGAAAIASDDQIYLVYESSVGAFNMGTNCQEGASEQAGPYTISMSVFDGTEWTVEEVVNDLPRAFKYPKIVVTDTHLHIAAIEDHFLPSLNENTASPSWTTTRYCDYPYIFGEIKHFSKTIDGAAWSSLDVIDLHTDNSITEAYDYNLRLRDLLVADDDVFVLFSHIDDEFSSESYGINNHFWASVSADETSFSEPKRLASRVSGGLSGLQVESAKLFKNTDDEVFGFILGQDYADPNDLEDKMGLIRLEDNISSLETIEAGTLRVNQNGIFTAVPEQSGGEASNDTQYFVYFPSSDGLDDQKSKLLELAY